MPFPAEQVPDGLLLTTHHYTLGLLLAAVGVLVVWDDYARREPLLTFLAVLTGLTAFLLAWRVHPVTAAILSLCAAVAVVLLPLSPTWSDYPLRWRVVVIIGGLVALDDAVSHALGLWTPLDALYQTGLWRMFP